MSSSGELWMRAVALLRCSATVTCNDLHMKALQLIAVIGSGRGLTEDSPSSRWLMDMLDYYLSLDMGTLGRGYRVLSTLGRRCHLDGETKSGGAEPLRLQQRGRYSSMTTLETPVGVLAEHQVATFVYQ